MGAKIARRSIDIVREQGIRGFLSGLYRFIWWRGGRDIEFYLRSKTNRPAHRTIGGTTVKFKVGTRDEIKRVTTFSGEKPVISWFVNHIRPTDTVWDVGANIGAYSLFARPHASSVVAFEPHPKNVKRLKENASLNNLPIDIRPIALSDRSDEAKLAVGKKVAGAGGGAIAKQGEYDITVEKGSALPGVPDVIKIDVEGNEIETLQGLGSKLKDIRTILIEVHGSEDINKAISILHNNGIEAAVRWEIGTRSFVVGSNSQ